MLCTSGCKLEAVLTWHAQSAGFLVTALYKARLQLAKRFGVATMPPAIDQKVGIAQSVRSDLLPLNALRHTPEEGTSGWFIWAGAEPSSDPAFFAPLHVSHVSEWCPEILPYLALPPGWRVLLAPGYEEVWFDDELV
jgi:hypothetical protein